MDDLEKNDSMQTVEQNQDGSVYVKFTTTQMPEVFRWGQGHTVKALGVAELVEKVKDESEKMRGDVWITYFLVIYIHVTSSGNERYDELEKTIYTGALLWVY